MWKFFEWSKLGGKIGKLQILKYGDILQFFSKGSVILAVNICSHENHCTVTEVQHSVFNAKWTSVLHSDGYWDVAISCTLRDHSLIIITGLRKRFLKRETRTLTMRCLRSWRSGLPYLISRRVYEDVNNYLFFTGFRRYNALRRNKKCSLERTLLITSSHFEHVFQHIGDEQCLKHFRFMRSGFLRIVVVITARPDQYSTWRNIYPSTRLLAACVVLKRLSTPQRWSGLEVMFRKHTTQHSEIFSEALE